MDITRDTFMARFDGLTPTIQNALTSFRILAAYYAIGKKRGLSEAQVKELADIGTLIVIGILQKSEAAAHIEKRCAISRPQAEIIAKDLESDIFANLNLFGSSDISPEDLSRAYDDFMSSKGAPAGSLELLDGKLNDIIKLPSEESHYSEAGMKPEPAEVPMIPAATATEKAPEIPLSQPAAPANPITPESPAPEPNKPDSRPAGPTSYGAKDPYREPLE